jgi:uncharacterized protein
MGDLKTVINEGYTTKGDFIILGNAMLNGEVVDAQVKIPLKTMNRHGLVAGATGTGKTKTLQVIAEELSKKGVPCVMMDIKGDLSGIAAPGITNPIIEERSKALSLEWIASGMPVELMTLSQGDGVRLKATVTEFGPVLLSKILGLNDTQSSVISLIFMYCDNQKLPLIDLKDLRKTLQYVMNEGKESIAAEYGAVSPATVNIIMRKVIELEQQGAEQFFGERSFDVADFTRHDSQGRGMISIIRLMDIQNKPKLFSTFMLSLLAEIYATFPEVGDADKPKLCLFIDEAHLVFEEATKELQDQVESVIKLIRSKGVGIYFCTQNPIDIPDDILAQLGLKVQHALRAFTEKDRKAIEKASENYPISEFYKTDELITQLGIGTAFVTALSEKGMPTPLAHVMCRPPVSRMDILTSDEVKALISNSQIATKYNEEIDRESAYEILTGKIERAGEPEHQGKLEEDRLKAEDHLREKQEKEQAEHDKQIERDVREEEKAAARLKIEQEKTARAASKENTQMVKNIAKAATSRSGQSIIGAIARGILGVFGIK